MSGETHTCGARVGRGFHNYPCGKTAKVEHDGRWYCGTHDPARRTARHEAWQRKYAAEDRVREANTAVRNRETDLLDAVRDSDEASLPAPVLRALDWLRDAEAKRDVARAALRELGA